MSILIPARNEEETLPATLPRILEAASVLDADIEILVITPEDSPFLRKPATRDPRVRWLATTGPGKFRALQVGVARAEGEALLLIDADVVPAPDAFAALLAPIGRGEAEVVAGRIAIRSVGDTAVARLLSEWAAVSAEAWHLLRSGDPMHRWALPGALYALRRELFPEELRVPLVDDASIGLAARQDGARFGYAAQALAGVSAPSSYRSWWAQKLRSRRGWAALAVEHPAAVLGLERRIRGCLEVAQAGHRTASLMQAQDRMVRLAARVAPAPAACASGSWSPTRPATAGSTTPGGLPPHFVERSP